MVDLITSIEEIETLIFAYNIKAAMDKIAKLTEDLILLSSQLDPSALAELMKIMNAMNFALTNKDYLLLNDNLHYALIPFLKENV